MSSCRGGIERRKRQVSGQTLLLEVLDPVRTRLDQGPVGVPLCRHDADEVI